MATLQDVIRRITLIGRSEGLDKVEADLQAVARAQGGVAVATERTEKTTLSLQRGSN